LIAGSLKKRSTRKILEANLDRESALKNDFILWLHNVRSLHNVGAAFRNADAFGVKEIFLSGYTPLPPRPEITKTAIGAEEHVLWSAIEKPLAKIDTLKSRGYQIVGLEQTDSSELLSEFSPVSRKVCLILGNEVTGIDSGIIPYLDKAVEIPQFGMKHSLNVSVACGVALYAFLLKLQSSS
jgi:tRNA G18 (ribose-2'-O)-methylase SpoU